MLWFLTFFFGERGLSQSESNWNLGGGVNAIKKYKTLLTKLIKTFKPTYYTYRTSYHRTNPYLESLTVCGPRTRSCDSISYYNIDPSMSTKSAREKVKDKRRDLFIQLYNMRIYSSHSLRGSVDLIVISYLCAFLQKVKHIVLYYVYDIYYYRFNIVAGLRIVDAGGV